MSGCDYFIEKFNSRFGVDLSKFCLNEYDKNNVVAKASDLLYEFEHSNYSKYITKQDFISAFSGKLGLKNYLQIVEDAKKEQKLKSIKGYQYLLVMTY